MSATLYKLDFASGKSYIGVTTTPMYKRFIGHRTAARRNRGNAPVLAAWRDYGEPHVTILAFVDKSIMLACERRAMIAFNTIIPNGYNASAPGMPSAMKGRKQTIESRKQMSASKRQIFKKYELNGESLCISDWAEKIGISVRGLCNRFARGWPEQRALTEKSRGY